MTWNKFRIVDDVSVCWCDIFRVPRSQYVRVTLAVLGLGFRFVAKQRNWSTIFFPLYVAWCMRIQRRTVRVAENSSWIASAVNTKRNNITTELRSIFYFLIHNTLRILHSNSTSQRTHTHAHTHQGNYVRCSFCQSTPRMAKRNLFATFVHGKSTRRVDASVLHRRTSHVNISWSCIYSGYSKLNFEEAKECIEFRLWSLRRIFRQICAIISYKCSRAH